MAAGNKIDSKGQEGRKNSEGGARRRRYAVPYGHHSPPVVDGLQRNPESGPEPLTEAQTKLGEQINAKREFSPRNFHNDPGIVNGVKTNAPPLQARLKIGQPGDKYEQEADETSKKVVNAPEKSIQPKADETPPGEVQKKPEKSVSRLVMPKMDFNPTEAVQNRLQAKHGPDGRNGMQNGFSTKTVPPLASRLGLPELQKAEEATTEFREAEAERNHQLAEPGDLPTPPPTVQKAEEETAAETPEVQAVPEVQADTGNEKAFAPPGDEAEGNTAQNSLLAADAGSPPLMLKNEAGESFGTAALEDNLSSTKGQGQALDSETQDHMGSQIGADFSGVRVHTGSNANEMNRSLGAQAFTHGSDIYFNEGKYDTQSSSGKELLAHELTHTVQQGAAPPVQTKKDPAASGDGPEIQAKPEYKPTDDGKAPAKRLAAEEKEEVGADEIAEAKGKSKSEAREAAGEVDSGEKNSEKSAKKPLAKPNKDRPKEQGEKAGKSAEKTKDQIENPEEMEEKEEAKDPEKKDEKPITPEAEEAEGLKQAALAEAAALPQPEEVPAVEVPTSPEYIDSAGEPAEPDFGAEIESHQLTLLAHSLRVQGLGIQEQATAAEKEALKHQADWEETRKQMSISEHYLSEGQKNIEQRTEALETADQAHEKSEERADTTLKEAPKKLEENEAGLKSTEPVEKDAERAKQKNEESAPEDSDAKKDTAEQGGKMEKQNEDIGDVGEGMQGSKKELTQLKDKAQEAKTKNADSKGKIEQTKQEVGQMQGKVDEMTAVNLKGRAALEETRTLPTEMRKDGKQLKEVGKKIVKSSMEMEARLHDAAKNRQARSKSLPSREQLEKESGGGEGTIQRSPEPGKENMIQRAQGDYAKQRGDIDIDKTPDFLLDKKQLKIKQKNKEELAHIKSMIGDRSMEDVHWAEKIGIGIWGKTSRFFKGLWEKFTWANVGKLFIKMLNPLNWLKLGFNLMFGGIIGGVGMIAGGVKNLVDNFGFNWATLKALADIATGIAMVAGTIAGIAIGISALLTVLVILSWGGYLPIAILQSPVLANVISVSGTIAMWAGGIGLGLHAIALGKSLYDVGAASSSEELQAQMNDVTEDSGRALVSALAMFGGKYAKGRGTALKGFQGPKSLGLAKNSPVLRQLMVAEAKKYMTGGMFGKRWDKAFKLGYANLIPGIGLFRRGRGMFKNLGGWWKNRKVTPKKGGGPKMKPGAWWKNKALPGMKSRWEGLKSKVREKMGGKNWKDRAPTGTKPPKELRSPNRNRHQWSKVGKNTRVKGKTSLVDDTVNLAEDAKLINQGHAQKISGPNGPEWRLPNGRKYGVHDGTLYPIKGPGIYGPMSRGTFKALTFLKKQGDSPGAWKQIRMDKSISPAEASKAYDYFNKLNKKSGGPTGGGGGGAATTTGGAASKGILGRFKLGGGHSLKVSRVNGKIIFEICSTCMPIHTRLTEVLGTISNKGPTKSLYKRIDKLRARAAKAEADFLSGARPINEIHAEMSQIGAHLRDLNTKFKGMAPGLDLYENMATFRSAYAKYLSDLRKTAVKNAAERHGYTVEFAPNKVPFDSHGQPAFYSSSKRQYLTRDVDEHTGAGWKIFSKNGKRLGTYDENLNRIRD